MPTNAPLFPDQASTYAESVDAIFFVILALTIFFTVLVLGLLLFFTVRFRRGNKVNRSRPVHTDLRIELAWSIIPLIMSLGIFFWAAKPYASVFHPPANAREVFVIGKQWMWHIQHTNGVRENNELHIPVGQPIKLTMISQDVIHDFYVPAFRVKRDVIPGRYTSMWFKPTKTGRFHLYCAEYCGTQHSEMVGWVEVMEPADFQAWLASGGSRAISSVQQTQTMEQAGAAIYNQMACGTCHDPDGIGRGPSLLGLYGTKARTKTGEFVPVDDVYLRKSILFPSDDVAANYQQVMPSYKDQLSEDQVLQLIAYIRSLSMENMKRQEKLPGASNSGIRGVSASTGTATPPSAAGSALSKAQDATTQSRATPGVTGLQTAPPETHANPPALQSAPAMPQKDTGAGKPK